MRRVGSIHDADPVGDAESRARTGRRGDRIRPGRSLLVFPALAATAWALLIAGFATVSKVFGPEDDGGTWAEVAGAALGNFVVAFVVALLVSVLVRAAGRPGATTDTPASPEPRRILRGAVLGALPGFLIIVVPVVLHEFDVISSDQSQIGFVGLPILVIGALVGIATAAADSGSGPSAVLGGLAGFGVGLGAGIVVAAAIPGLPLVPVLLAPVGMISGAALAAHARDGHREEPAGK